MPTWGALSVGATVRTLTSLNVRSTPSLAGAIVGTESAGNTGSVRAMSGSWAQVAYSDGVTGWSSVSFLAPVATSMMNDSQTAQLGALYAAVQSLLSQIAQYKQSLGQ